MSTSCAGMVSSLSSKSTPRYFRNSRTAALSRRGRPSSENRAKLSSKYSRIPAHHSLRNCPINASPSTAKDTGGRAKVREEPAAETRGRMSRKQILLPPFDSRRVFATQKRHDRKERSARLAQRIVERLPVVVVLAIVVGAHVLEMMRFPVRAPGTAFDLVQVLE